MKTTQIDMSSKHPNDCTECNLYKNQESCKHSQDLLTALEAIQILAESGVIQRNETGKPQWSLLDELKRITGEVIAKARGGEQS
jgi:hypothetical protein